MSPEADFNNVAEMPFKYLEGLKNKYKYGALWLSEVCPPME